MKMKSLVFLFTLCALFFIIPNELFALTTSQHASSQQDPQKVPIHNPVHSSVQLAKVYNNQDVQHYLVSEKFDGVRAIWKDQQLWTRAGHLIHAPTWFTEKLPKVWLDGELWFKRQSFETIASIVTKQTPIDSEWEKITYMIFDAPNYTDDFQTRALRYRTLIEALGVKHIRAVEQIRVETIAQLNTLLETYTNSGAEGLILHKADALFVSGRSENLLKLKTYMDAEATVIGHVPGKGKYVNLMGSLLLEYTHPTGESIQFKLGTGFSDKQRANPPAIGSRVTFRYHGFTRKGVPRFASFMRQR
jgi:DNA ligase-1